MMAESYIFLAGASRGVGREIAKYLTAQQRKVKAMLRSSDSRNELEAMGIKVQVGDALDVINVEAALSNGESISTVISTIGGLPKDGERADFLGNKNLIDAAVKARVQKFILVSSIGSGNSVVALSPTALETLGPVLVEKEKAEKYLIESGLIYTIIRPGGLKSEPATGNGVLTEDYKISGMIHRADVAQLVGRCVVSDRTNNKVFSAVDRNQLFGNPTVDEFSLS
ncbi:SDR family oxidoreductase [Kamptonema sp. UHCC 0994]|uniref:SDR family oxidoreductase n=1 Tax=Kamptonema sp. UHCC 0994 TaxID=3031329 RepID=UPI0023B928C0|nr:SDR family oxidoreductase [Kamptonema sp. UHCC 0994]MDF0553172.1 SDR family oxidoreductase [Kamptonema sp. UHCC 0994]